MHDTAFTIFSLVAIILVALPASWHWRAGNVGTLMSIGWILMANVIFFVNSIIWMDNVSNWAPVWCDITAKIIIGIGPGITASSLCINRRLAIIAMSRQSISGQQSRRMDIAIDLGLGIGAPVLIMILSYIPQPHRFNIIEGFGCAPANWPTWVAIVLVYIWPLIFGLLSAIYGAFAMHSFLSRRLRFNSILQGSKSGLTTGTFLRLCAFATSDLILTIPFAIYYLQAYIKTLRPWVSWDAVHGNFGIVYYYDATLLFQKLDYSVPTYPTTYWIQKWTCVLAAVIFFAFFGLTDEAIRDYIRWMERFSMIWQRLTGRATHSVKPMNFPSLGTTVVATGGKSEQVSGPNHEDSLGDLHVEEMKELPYAKSRSFPVTVRIDKDIV